MPSLLAFMHMVRGRVDVSKLTTNGFWGTEALCDRTFDQLLRAGLLDNRFVVPLVMVSIGEQSIGLDRVCRIIHTIATGFSPQELNVGLSALTVRGGRHSVKELKATYGQMFGEFPEDRVHATIRVYLVNERLGGQPELPSRSHKHHPVDASLL